MEALIALTARVWSESPLAPWGGFLAAGLVLEAVLGRLQPLGRIFANLRITVLYAVIIFALGPTVVSATSLVTQSFGAGWIDFTFLEREGIGWQVVFALANLFVLDLFIYWFHRLQHTVPWMWDVHAVHHADEHFNVTTTTVHSWLHFIMMAIGVTVPMTILFKLPAATNWVIGMTLVGWMFVTHLNIKFSFGRLSWLIVGPQVHRIHHSALREHMNKNFAGYFPVWDIVFGTYYAPKPDEYPPTGLCGGQKIETTSAMLFGPIMKWGTRLARCSRELVGRQVLNRARGTS